MTDKEPFSILLVDADETTSPTLKKQFNEDSHYPASLDVSRNSAEALEKLKTNHYHVILADYSVGGNVIVEILSEIQKRKLTTPVVLIVDPNGEAQARNALKTGATDYFVKTQEELQKLPDRLWSIYRNYELRTSNENMMDEITFQNMHLLETNEKLRNISIRDPLTGLFNHRHLQEKLMDEFARAVRHSHPLSCILIDLDQFHEINEQRGHGVGDEVLKEAAGIVLSNSRISDFVGRFGGEEFAMILPHIDYQGAQEMGERLRKIFAEHAFLADTERISVTVSLGICSFPEDAMKHRGDLFNFSDQALFRAKSGGRNRVFLYRDILPTIGETLPHLKISSDKVLEFQRKLSGISDQARRGYIESSRALIKALESKDRFTAGHSGRVAGLSMQVAETMGLTLDEAEVVEHAGLLHDIGKICISDDILLKPERLSLAEYEAMKQHPYLGYRILKPIKFLQEEATLVLHHHEWYNGQGYPCRLSKNEIPLGARIVAVIDSYDTMRLAGGRYKKVMTVEECAAELIACSGTQFDPEVVQAFIQVLLMRKDLTPEGYDKKRLAQALGIPEESK